MYCSKKRFLNMPRLNGDFVLHKLFSGHCKGIRFFTIVGRKKLVKVALTAKAPMLKKELEGAL